MIKKREKSPNEVYIGGQIMADKQKSNFKTLVRFISEIADLYFMALTRKPKETFSEVDEELSDYELFVVRVRKAYSRLNQEEKKIINNDFFYQEYPDWWKKLYTKSTYYRLKQKSMIRFKEVLEDEI